MPSLRRKIGLGSAAFVALIALLALLSYVDLRYLERRIEAGVVSYDFLKAVLDSRLAEEAFLLSRDIDKLKAALDHAERAQGLLASNRAAFLALQGQVSNFELSLVETFLRDYAADLSRYSKPAARSPPGEGADNKPNRPGVRLVAIADALAKAERGALIISVKRSQDALLASIILVAGLGFAAARLLSSAFLRPLSWLEAEVSTVGEGRNRRLRPISRDREILSVSRAVNRMLDEIEARNRRLLQSEKLASLGTLASGVAHELNNPLSNISSSCQILIEELEQQAPTDALEWLCDIDRETERARQIVKSIIDFAKEGRLHKTEVILADVIADSLLLLGLDGSPRVETSGIAADIPVFADGQKLQQVFINLLKNAVDSGPSTLISVRARAMSAQEFRFPAGTVTGKRVCTADFDKPVLVIEIEDNGRGIPLKVLPRVFDPFFTTKDVGHGDGLGLWVTQEILDLHGGCVGVHSQVGHGTRVFICLPHENSLGGVDSCDVTPFQG